MFCLATKILTYLPFFYLIIFMTSNCQDALVLNEKRVRAYGTHPTGRLRFITGAMCRHRDNPVAPATFHAARRHGRGGLQR